MYKTKNKIRKIQTLSGVQVTVQVCMCTSWNSHVDKVNEKGLHFDGLISSKSVPLRQGMNIIIYVWKTRVYIA